VSLVPHFELDEERSDAGAHIVNVSGEIHVSTAPSFQERLNAVIEGGGTMLVLDLSGVEFIDSTGLSVLLNGLRLINQRHGRMALVCANPTVMRLFQITGLEATFDIFEDRAAAIARVAQPAEGSTDGAP
jgi:anti-sigma B factor antagonist